MLCTQSEREQIKIGKQTVVRAVISIYTYFPSNISSSVIRCAKSQSTIQYMGRRRWCLVLMSVVEGGGGGGGGGRRKMTRRKRQSEYLSNSIFRDGGRHMKMANKCWRRLLYHIELSKNDRHENGSLSLLSLFLLLSSVFSSRKISEKSVAAERVATRLFRVPLHDQS